jgi:hypothetical protein
MKRKINPIIAMMLIAIAALTTSAHAEGGGHLWFYSTDPGTLNPPELLPNPQYYDPKYISSSPDPWLNESIVIPSSDWETPFTIWLACAQFESLNTKLVISINKAAYEAINKITVDGFEITSWTSGGHPYLAPHGVFNSAEFFGYAEVDVGNLYSPPGTPYKKEITIKIELKDGADLTNAKIHFDAYGFTEDGSLIFSPYSHDLNFIIPEPATIFMAVASIAALGAYAYKRKR